MFTIGDNGSVFVFFDSNQNGVYNPKVGDIILRVMEEVPENSQLNFTGDNLLFLIPAVCSRQTLENSLTALQKLMTIITNN